MEQRGQIDMLVVLNLQITSVAAWKNISEAIYVLQEYNTPSRDNLFLIT